jgi:hypothetical protein
MSLCRSLLHTLGKQGRLDGSRIVSRNPNLVGQTHMQQLKHSYFFSPSTSSSIGSNFSAKACDKVPALGGSSSCLYSMAGVLGGASVPRSLMFPLGLIGRGASAPRRIMLDVSGGRVRPHVVRGGVFASGAGKGTGTVGTRREAVRLKTVETREGQPADWGISRARRSSSRRALNADSNFLAKKCLENNESLQGAQTHT